MGVTFFNQNCCTFKTVAAAFLVSVVSRKMLLSFFDRVKKASPVKMAERCVAVFAIHIHLEGLKHLFNVFGSCGYSGFPLYRPSAGRQRRIRSSRKRRQLNQLSLMLLSLFPHCVLSVSDLLCLTPSPPFNDPSILDIIVLHFSCSPFISPRHSPLGICIYRP